MERAEYHAIFYKRYENKDEPQLLELVLGKFDTTDKNAMEVFETFPFSPCVAWLTYQKNT